MNHPINKKVLMPVMLLGSFLSILNQTILNVALPDLMEEFEIGPTTVDHWLYAGKWDFGTGDSLFDETIYY
ncbi:hypothetical protein [Virgibacillus phasianinus]|uniref:hypothetical protein n=1 Tax=Virgibacillus phasianinus TaxID=2017483 RepID=UPI0026B2E77D